jgi:hypothetical protein
MRTHQHGLLFQPIKDSRRIQRNTIGSGSEIKNSETNLIQQRNYYEKDNYAVHEVRLLQL